MRRTFLRTVGLLGVLGLFLHQPLSAQDTFELEVYPYATAHRGEWELEAYVNHLSRGTKVFDGPVAPTDDQWRFAARKLEFVPILERQIAGAQLILNPTIERHMAGPENGEWEFEPRARLAFPVGRVTLGFEYHGGWGENVHQFYPTADFELPGDVELHLGVGFGATTSGDRLVFKTRFEIGDL
jgi:hypothetical protein